jgi:8-oxo-dGTP pyrophosphatase MutT (NUDIX family)
MSPPTSIKGVLIIEGQVVLLRNSRQEWELPGGRLENGENHSATLTREFAEELSVNVLVERAIDSYLFEVIPGRQVFIVTYGCTLIGDFQPTVSDEHLDHCLWPVDQLSALNLPVGYRRSIEAWAKAIKRISPQESA